MTKGYLILAQNSGSMNYIRMAYALALSIKGTQSEVNKVAIATDDMVPDKYKHAFDHIVKIPWADHAKESRWKIENTWKFYHMTPFDETVVLDADMLFPADISHWWDVLSLKDVWVTNKPRTFRGELITSTKYRQVHVSNNLPHFYIAFFYFKKSELAAEMFKLTQIIYDNWERFYYDYLDETRPKFNSGDVSYALAIKILGAETECFDTDSIPTFVHMKSALQNIDPKYISDDWTQNIPTYFTDDCRFKIGNYEQYLPFHYHIKNWLTNDMINKLERKIGI